jgi:hypothetical protein
MVHAPRDVRGYQTTVVADQSGPTVAAASAAAAGEGKPTNLAEFTTTLSSTVNSPTTVSMDELRVVITSNDIYIACTTESWLTATVPSNLINIEGCWCCRRLRKYTPTQM